MASLESVVQQLRLAQARSSAVRYSEHAVLLFLAWIVAVFAWSRLTPLEETRDLAALGLPVAVGLLAIAWVLARPRPMGLMRGADAALDLKERLSTAWERRFSAGPMDESLRRDALTHAGRTRLAAAFPIRWRSDEAAALVVLAAAAAALALLPNSMDLVLSQRHADRAAQTHAAATITAAQRKLAAAPSPAPVDPQVQKILQDAQARIASAPNPRSAIQNITPAEQQLLQLADPQTPARASSAQNLANNLSGTAAGRNVAQSIDASPSQGAQSLRSLATQLQSLSPEQRAQLAAALAAASNQAQDPAMAAAMQQASGALAQGDLSAASQDLSTLAGQLDSLQQQMSNDQEIAAAINSLEAARQQLATQADRDAAQSSASASPAAGASPGTQGATNGSGNG